MARLKAALVPPLPMPKTPEELVAFILAVIDAKAEREAQDADNLHASIMNDLHDNYGG